MESSAKHKNGNHTHKILLQPFRTTFYKIRLTWFLILHS